MSNNEELKMTKSSGNIFNDLGYTNPDEYLLKVKFAMVVNKIIKDKNLTQMAAAKILEIDQPKISRLSRGQLAGFSLDKLMTFLILLNQDIEVNIKPHSSNMSYDNLSGHFSLNYPG
jgi:predicted XRE-type DNA-binding protein